MNLFNLSADEQKLVGAIPVGLGNARSATEIIASLGVARLNVEGEIVGTSYSIKNVTEQDRHKFRRVINALRDRKGVAICSSPSGFYRPSDAYEASIMARALAAQGWGEVKRARQLVDETVWNEIKQQEGIPLT
jgi:hypothetical protein